MWQNSQINNLVLSFLILLGAVGIAAGQEQQTADEQIDDVPPPLVALSKSESAQLTAATSDLKKRTILCLQLADSRLQQAETLTNNADFQDALSELGGYQAVINNGLDYFKSLKNDSSKVRDNVKRLEIALRQHAPRLETIRRSTPFEYSLRLKSILNFARNARSSALSLFFSDTVLANDAVQPSLPANSGSTILNLEKKQQ